MRILIIIFSYILGSVSSAILVGKIKGVPVTRQGTKNPGAFNVYHLIGLRWGLLTALFDLCKGLIPTYLAKEILNYNIGIVILVAISAIVGHIWPLQHEFDGGRGLATTMGTMAVMDFPGATLAFFVGGLLVFLLRKLTARDIRFPYIVYPLFTLWTLLSKFQISLLLYGIAVIMITFSRAWQVRNR